MNKKNMMKMQNCMNFFKIKNTLICMRLFEIS